MTNEQAQAVAIAPSSHTPAEHRNAYRILRGSGSMADQCLRENLRQWVIFDS